MDCFSCIGGLEERQITTVVNRSLLESSRTINMSELLQKKLFLVFSRVTLEGKTSYSYLKLSEETGSLEWDTKDDNPATLIRRMDAHLQETEDTLELKGDESLASYILGFGEMQKHREYVKASTQNIGIGMALVLSNADLYEYAKRTGDEEDMTSYFSCTQTIASFGNNPALKEFGLFLASSSDKKTAILNYVPVTRTLEHVTGESKRNRVLVNRAGDTAFAFDREMNEWRLQTSQVDTKHLEAFANDGLAWTTSGEKEEEAATNNDEGAATSTMPVLICDNGQTRFLTADHLPEEKKSELVDISKNNRVYRLEPFVNSGRSLFKHASSVTVHSLVAGGTGLETVYTVKNSERNENSEECATWLRFAEA